jgi:undecaprenol kinase
MLGVCGSANEQQCRGEQPLVDAVHCSTLRQLRPTATVSAAVRGARGARKLAPGLGAASVSAMKEHKNRSFPVRLKCALQGFAHGLRAEASLRLQAACAAAALLALILLHAPAVWWALVLLASAAVLAAELFNTAIEHLADELHPHDSPGIRNVKDIAAAGVLLAVLGALGVALAFAVRLLWT